VKRLVMPGQAQPAAMTEKFGFAGVFTPADPNICASATVTVKGEGHRHRREKAAVTVRRRRQADRLASPRQADEAPCPLG
jgi:hypothetical protein